MPINERPSESGPGGQEHELRPAFLVVRRFPDMETAGRAYGEAQRALRRDAENSDISIYRIQTGEGYTAHVIALGDTPGSDLAAKLDEALTLGVPAEVDEDVLGYLIDRREQAKQLGPWVEQHSRPGRPVWLDHQQRRNGPDADRARKRHETQKKKPNSSRRDSWKKKRH